VGRIEERESLDRSLNTAPGVTNPPGSGVGPGFYLCGYRQVRVAVVAMAKQAEGIVPEVAHREPEVAELGVLADMDEFVCHQFAATAVITVVLEKDPAPDGHTGSTTWQHRHGHDPNALRQGGVEYVVGCEFGPFQTAHDDYVTAVSNRGRRRVVSDHYTRVPDLAGAILAALGDADLGIDDLAPVDEFHLGGAVATAALAADLGLGADDHLLDIGCGIGGPARRFASLAGCRVTGVDLTPSFVDAAGALSAAVGLADRTRFVVGDATALTVDRTVTAAVLIHVGMNVPDKRALFAAVGGLLAPGSRFAIYDIMRVGDGEFDLPQPFASEASQAHVETPAAYIAALEAGGFVVSEPVDRTQMALQATAAASEQGPTPVSLATVMGPDVSTMLANLGAALRSGILAPMQIIATR